MRWVLVLCGPLLVASIPRIDPTARLHEGLVPADAAVGTPIYRLRASDPLNHPLKFSLVSKSIYISLETLNCTAFNSLCQANVVVIKRLEVGRFYDFTVSVTNTKQQSIFTNCSFRATDATTHIERIFPGAPHLISVSESARRNTELATITARGNPSYDNPVFLELWGSPQFSLYQKLKNERDAEATVTLLRSLDYEEKTVHHLKIVANDPWTEIDKDTRNIAIWPLVVAVLDEQDTPPIFTLVPPTTTLSPTLKPGDVVLKVQAEDGDRGNPRDIRYGLIPDGNPFAPFFEISEDKGVLKLVKPLSELQAISRSNQPILLVVQAEEVRSNPQETPAQSSTVTLALIPPSIQAGSPTFSATEYTVLLDENSPTGTLLDITQAEITPQPGDVITLALENNNDTFEVSPNVVSEQTSFQIKVHDPKLLDYEKRKSVFCYIVARELGTGNFTARSKLTVLLNDVNDNPPEFIQEEFLASVQENAPLGTMVTRVEAKDVDREPGNKIRYTRLTGQGSHLFRLDSETGIITVANSEGLDAETSAILDLEVEAADEDGMGFTAKAGVTIELVDVNDCTPEFEKDLYEFILNQEKTGFTSDAFVEARDEDISEPNNKVHYELIDKKDSLFLDENTGELRLTKTWTDSDITVLRVRAWDGGVPRLSSECQVKIYPSDGPTRPTVFIVPGRNLDRRAVEDRLRVITGGKVVIHEIRPYTGYEPGAMYVNKGEDTSDKSVVVATITHPKNTVIDINHIQEILDQENVHVFRRKSEITQASSNNLLWLVILFIILAIITAIILILCCLCPPCPFYIPPKKIRRIASTEVEKLVVKGQGQGVESKSVQVAEWFGRREAWTPDQGIEIEADSLRRQEMERGSDRTEERRTIHRQAQIQREPSREQLYIREGNADILRLITRGNEQQQHQQHIPVTLVADPTYVTDSGKDILMRRFIDQQQAEAAKSQVLLPNAVNRLQQEHELLEASLRQQNAILRQLLIERERDLRLETQSLPAGTQTDQDAYTQTEPQFLSPPHRKVQSDNDASDLSDEELAIIKGRIKNRKTRRKSQIRRQIKTPIQEESELEITEKSHKTKIRSSEKPHMVIRQTKTSELRQKRAKSENRTRAESSRSGLRKEVLKEISASLNHSDVSNSNENLYDNKLKRSSYSYSDDSLEEISPRSDKTTDSGKHRYHSETDLRVISSQSQTKESVKSVKSQSQTDLNKPKGKTVPRYMEWYNKNNNSKDKNAVKENGVLKTKQSSVKKKKAETKKKPSNKSDKSEIEKEAVAKEQIEKETAIIGSRLLADTEASSRKKVDSKKQAMGPEHPLLQHSEYRFEAPYPARRPEEDADSGIALTRPAMAQKKSVFTIAYDDMHTSQIADNTTPPL